VKRDSTTFFASASIPTNTLGAIDTQSASVTNADQPLVSPGLSEERERLEKLLKNRSDAKDLQDKNILKSKLVFLNDYLHRSANPS
jgi:hypothetical protein